MISKPKKLIAREGLIIIGVIVGFIVIQSITGLLKTDFQTLEELPDDVLRSCFEQYENKYPNSSHDKKMQKVIKDDMDMQLIFWKNIRPDLQWRLGINYSDGLSKEEYKKCYNYAYWMTMRKNIYSWLNEWSIFLFIATYPLYWLIRFIIWAIKTLRER